MAARFVAASQIPPNQQFPSVNRIRIPRLDSTTRQAKLPPASRKRRGPWPSPPPQTATIAAPSLASEDSWKVRENVRPDSGDHAAARSRAGRSDNADRGSQPGTAGVL